MDTLLAVLTYIVGAEIALVLGAIAAPGYVRVVKVLIWAAAIPLAIWCFVWELGTEASMAIRIIVGLLVGTFVFVIVPETVRRVTGLNKAEASASNASTNRMGNVSGNTGIVTQGQQGNNTINRQ